MMVGDDVDDDAVMVAAVQVMVAALDRLLQTRFLSLSVLCPFPMPRYLGVRAKIEKGMPIWVAEAYGAELGRAPSEDKAAFHRRHVRVAEHWRYRLAPLVPA